MNTTSRTGFVKRVKPLKSVGFPLTKRSDEETKRLLIARLKGSNVFRELSGEAERERRARKVFPKKSHGSQIRNPVDLSTNPIAPKMIDFFKSSSSTVFKTKYQFLRAYTAAVPNTKISSAEYVLRELLRTGLIPEFTSKRVGRQAGFNKKEEVKKHLTQVSKESAQRAEAMKSPLFIQARKFGSSVLVEAYKQELAKPSPSQEKINEIEAVFNCSPQKFGIEWLRAKARAK